MLWFNTRALAIVWISAALLGAVSFARAQQSKASAVAALQAKHAELLPQLRASALGAPVVLSSREANDRVEGDVYAEVDHSLAQVASMFRSPARKAAGAWRRRGEGGHIDPPDTRTRGSRRP